MSERKLRVSHVTVTPYLVWDDGEELHPGPQAAPVSVPLSALAGLADTIRKELAKAEAQEPEAPRSGDGNA